MVDFLINNQLYVVLIIALIIWFGLVYYLFYLDKKISTLEKKTNAIFNKLEEKK